MSAKNPLAAESTASSVQLWSRNPGQFKALYTQGPLLGRGAFGTVYRCIPRYSGPATSALTRSSLAVKVVSKRSSGGSFAALAKREAEIMVKLRDTCPWGTVQIHEAMEDESNVYIVMELCKGGDLHRLIQRCGRVSEPTACSVMRQLAAALEHCHSMNILHRDVNTRNVFITSELPDEFTRPRDALSRLGMAPADEPFASPSGSGRQVHLPSWEGEGAGDFLSDESIKTGHWDDQPAGWSHLPPGPTPSSGGRDTGHVGGEVDDPYTAHPAPNMDASGCSLLPDDSVQDTGKLAPLGSKGEAGEAEAGDEGLPGGGGHDALQRRQSSAEESGRELGITAEADGGVCGAARDGLPLGSASARAAAEGAVEESTGVVVGPAEVAGDGGGGSPGLGPSALFQGDLVVKLADFGLARELKQGKDGCRGAMGAHPFRSPEMLKGTKYSFPTDVWSAGVVLCILLTGRPPFQEASRNDKPGLSQAILRAKVSFSLPEWGSVSLAAKGLVQRMLEPDPRRRISARDILLHWWTSQRGPPHVPRSLTPSRSDGFGNGAGSRWRRGITSRALAQLQGAPGGRPLYGDVLAQHLVAAGFFSHGLVEGLQRGHAGYKSKGQPAVGSSLPASAFDGASASGAAQAEKGQKGHFSSPGPAATAGYGEAGAKAGGGSALDGSPSAPARARPASSREGRERPKQMSPLTVSAEKKADEGRALGEASPVNAADATLGTCMGSDSSLPFVRGTAALPLVAAEGERQAGPDLQGPGGVGGKGQKSESLGESAVGSCAVERDEAPPLGSGGAAAAAPPRGRGAVAEEQVLVASGLARGGNGSVSVAAPGGKEEAPLAPSHVEGGGGKLGNGMTARAGPPEGAGKVAGPGRALPLVATEQQEGPWTAAPRSPWHIPGLDDVPRAESWGKQGGGGPQGQRANGEMSRAPADAKEGLLEGAVENGGVRPEQGVRTPQKRPPQKIPPQKSPPEQSPPEKMPTEKSPPPKTPPVKSPPEKGSPEKGPPEKSPPEKGPPEKSPPPKTPPQKTPPEKSPARPVRTASCREIVEEPDSGPQETQQKERPVRLASERKPLPASPATASLPSSQPPHDSKGKGMMPFLSMRPNRAEASRRDSSNPRHRAVQASAAAHAAGSAAGAGAGRAARPGFVRTWTQAKADTGAMSRIQSARGERAPHLEQTPSPESARAGVRLPDPTRPPSRLAGAASSSAGRSTAWQRWSSTVAAVAGMKQPPWEGDAKSRGLLDGPGAAAKAKDGDRHKGPGLRGASLRQAGTSGFDKSLSLGASVEVGGQKELRDVRGPKGGPGAGAGAGKSRRVKSGPIAQSWAASGGQGKKEGAIGQHAGAKENLKPGEELDKSDGGGKAPLGAAPLDESAANGPAGGGPIPGEAKGAEAVGSKKQSRKHGDAVGKAVKSGASASGADSPRTHGAPRQLHRRSSDGRSASVPVRSQLPKEQAQKVRGRKSDSGPLGPRAPPAEMKPSLSSRERASRSANPSPGRSDAPGGVAKWAGGLFKGAGAPGASANGKARSGPVSQGARQKAASRMRGTRSQETGGQEAALTPVKPPALAPVAPADAAASSSGQAKAAGPAAVPPSAAAAEEHQSGRESSAVKADGQGAGRSSSKGHDSREGRAAEQRGKLGKGARSHREKKAAADFGVSRHGMQDEPPPAKVWMISRMRQLLSTH